MDLNLMPCKALILHNDSEMFNIHNRQSPPEPLRGLKGKTYRVRFPAARKRQTTIKKQNDYGIRKL